MIAGLGIDLVEISRMVDKIDSGSGFKEHIFSKSEIQYCDKKKNRFEHYAGCFAAKEAFLKALGTGWVEGTAFNEIEILHDSEGKPLVNLLGNTKEKIELLKIIGISVSLSHVKSVAAAVVILEK